MADNSDQLGQDEIEKLLAQAKAAAEPTASSSAPVATAPAPAQPGNVAAAAAPARAGEAARGATSIPSGDIDLLFQQAEQALASINAAVPAPPNVTPFKLVDFSGATPSSENTTLELLRDVELDVKIELGRTHMYLEDVLKLNRGAVVPLDRLAGDPVDIYVNGRLIARGEVLIMNDNFCVRVAELVAGEQAVA